MVLGLFAEYFCDDGDEMSRLSNEVYEYLNKTRKQVLKSELNNIFNVNNDAMTRAIEALEDRIERIRIGGKFKYFVGDHVKPQVPRTMPTTIYKQDSREWKRINERVTEYKTIKSIG